MCQVLDQQAGSHSSSAIDMEMQGGLTSPGMPTPCPNIYILHYFASLFVWVLASCFPHVSFLGCLRTRRGQKDSGGMLQGFLLTQQCWLLGSIHGSKQTPKLSLCSPSIYQTVLGRWRKPWKGEICPTGLSNFQRILMQQMLKSAFLK